MNITSGDLCDLLGVPATTLNDWCKRKILKPKGEGKGHGHHRQFSLEQVVALAFGLEWSQGDWLTAHAAKIVEFLTGFTEKQLTTAFAAGRTHLRPALPKMSLVESHRMSDVDMFDVQRVYDDVKNRLSKIEKKSRPNKIGRNRGLSA